MGMKRAPWIGLWMTSLEIGGFQGRWAHQMYDKFHCYISIYEPQMWAVERMRAQFRFVKDPEKIRIYPYGLWTEDARLPMGEWNTDGCSVLKSTRESGEGDFRDIRKEMRPESDIDVCLMNIEGAEYDLLPVLIETKLISKIKYFWCQFHTFVDNADVRTAQIFLGLSQTHEKIWDYFPTATAWKRIDQG
jgi:FkbM family methyltransferase